MTVQNVETTFHKFRLTYTDERSRARVCGGSLAGIVCLNPAGGMDVCLLLVSSVVR